MRLPLVPIIIDEFGSRHDGFNGRVYFLTHFHTDHMKGITPTWSSGKLFCTIITATLLRTKFCTCRPRRNGGVGGSSFPVATSFTEIHSYATTTVATTTSQPTKGGSCICEAIVELEYETPYMIDVVSGRHQRHFTQQRNAVDDGGSGPTVVVVLVPARHIPGSAMLLFPNTVVGSILVTGDFKYEAPEPPSSKAAETRLLRIGRKRGRNSSILLTPRVPDPMIDSVKFWLRELRPRATSAATLMRDDDIESSGDGEGTDDNNAKEDVVSRTSTEDLLLQLGGDMTSSPRNASVSPVLEEHGISNNPNVGDRHRKGCDDGHDDEEKGFETVDLLDHLYIDDTWLHLTATMTATSSSPIATAETLKSKLLTSPQLVQAFKALKATIWFQCNLQQQNNRNKSNAEPISSHHPCRRPFVVRVFIHNNFGKEALLATLAAILGDTTVVVDAGRYALLAALAHAGAELAAPHPPTNETPALGEHSDMTGSLLNVVERQHQYQQQGLLYTDYGIRNSDLFVTREDLSTKLKEWATKISQEEPLPARGPIVPPGCIEVVSTRSEVSDWALREAAGKETTPYYGLVMTGWARTSTNRPSPTTTLLSGSTSTMNSLSSASNVFEVPYSLHTSPENLVDFVKALRPRSVCAQHAKESRVGLVMSKLGPYLYKANASASQLEVRTDIPIPLAWRRFVSGAPLATSHQQQPGYHADVACPPPPSTAAPSPTPLVLGDRHWTRVVGGGEEIVSESGGGTTLHDLPARTAPHNEHHYSNSRRRLGNIATIMGGGSQDILAQLSRRRLRAGTKAVTIQRSPSDDDDDDEAHCLLCGGRGSDQASTGPPNIAGSFDPQIGAPSMGVVGMMVSTAVDIAPPTGLINHSGPATTDVTLPPTSRLSVEAIRRPVPTTKIALDYVLSDLLQLSQEAEDVDMLLSQLCSEVEGSRRAQRWRGSGPK